MWGAPSLEPRENKIGNPNFFCSDSFLECFGYSNKSLENSGIIMMSQEGGKWVVRVRVRLGTNSNPNRN